MELLEKMAVALPELLLTAIFAFQVFLFRQISEARRDHLKLRIEIAQNHPSHTDVERAMDKLETNFLNQLELHFNTLLQRINTP